MAEHEYYEVNGRQIRVRPTESGQEIDEYGNFHRQPNHFTKGFGEGENPVEADRYILFWGKGCNWSNRASIARELLGLDKAIKVEIVDWGDYEKPLGWEFVNSPNHINKETGAQFLSELYYNADDDYEGRTTVPVLVDYKEKKVVNNDYHHLTNHFETAFKPLHKKGAPDLYIEDGTTDLAIIDVAMYNAYQKEYNYDVVANQISDEDAKAIADNSYAYYIFPKDQEELRDKVDEQLKELKKDGTLTELSQKYFGQDTAPEDDQFEKTPN